MIMLGISYGMSMRLWSILVLWMWELSVSVRLKLIMKGVIVVFSVKMRV